MSIYDNDFKSSGAKRDGVRRQILSEAGDSVSLLGSTSDANQILFYEISKFLNVVSSAESVDEIKNAASQVNSHLLGFANEVDNGSVKLPYLAKGIDSAMVDIKRRATAVWKALTGT